MAVNGAVALAYVLDLLYSGVRNGCRKLSINSWLTSELRASFWR